MKGMAVRSSHTRLYVHLEARLRAALVAKCGELRCVPLAVGGMPDHMHLLVQVHAAVDVATLVKELKGASSHLITHEVAPGTRFKWQASYGAFTVSPDLVPVVQTYIARQIQHHADGTVQREWEGPGD